MKIFGISLFTILLIAVAFWFGTKNPTVLAGLPLIG
jgi:hypothetical protein